MCAEGAATPPPPPLRQKTVRRRSRAASPTDLDSLVRILGVSGRRLVECGGEWRVLPGSDRRLRALMIVRAENVERLRADGTIVASANGYVLATEADAPHEERPAAGPWIFKAVGVPASNAGRRGFARLAEMARQGGGPLTLRQALAGLRLLEDAEQAARDHLLTMNWDAVPADKGARSGRNGGLSPHARRAVRRIERIRSVLGERDFTFVYSACVRRIHFKELEGRFGLRRLEARKLLPVVLEKVAQVYDG